MSAELVLHLELDKFEAAGGKDMVRDASESHHDGEIHGRVDIVADETFGACALFDGAAGNYISVPAGSFSNITGDLTIQAWAYVSAEPPVVARIVGRGDGTRAFALWSVVNGRWLFQRIAGKPQLTNAEIYVGSPIRALNTWYHLAGVIQGAKGTLYLHDVQGKCIGRAETNNMPSGAEAVTNDDLVIGYHHSYSTHSGKIAHVRLYNGARSQAEIERDIASDRLALAPFRKSHPVDFRLYDDDDQAVLYITDDPKGRNLNVELRNTSTQAIRLQGSELEESEGARRSRDWGAIVIDPNASASETNHHFALRFRPGTLSQSTLNLLVDPQKRATLLTPGDPWDVYFPSKQPEANEAVSLYLFYKGQDKTFQPNESRKLTLQRMSAAPGSGARGTQVELHPRGLTAAGDSATPITGMRTQYMHITNQQGRKNIPLHVWFAGGNTVLNDDNEHKLTIRISNGSDKEDIALDKTSKLVVSYDVGEKEDDNWALTDKKRTPHVTVKHGKTALHDTGGGEGVSKDWELTFPDKRVLARRGADKDPLEITLEGLKVSPQSSGHANLYVRYENIPGYQDGQFILTVEKSPLVVHHGNVGIGMTGPTARLSVNGGVHIGVGSGSDPGDKNLRVDGHITSSSLQLGASGPVVRAIAAASSAAVNSNESIPTVSFVNEMLGSMQDVLFFSAVQLLPAPDAELQLEFDPKHKPSVTVTGNIVKYSGLLKFTTRNLRFNFAKGGKYDDLMGELDQKKGTFNSTARIRLSVVTKMASGKVTLRDEASLPGGMPATWALSSDGSLHIHLLNNMYSNQFQTLYQYSASPFGPSNDQGKLHDNFKETIHWIDLSEITYSL